MRFEYALLVAFLMSASVDSKIEAGEPYDDGRVKKARPRNSSGMDGSGNPFYVNEGQAQPYEVDRSLYDNEIAIERHSTTADLTIKTAYDRKGNMLSISAWERKTGRGIKINLDVLSQPIVKDEIESTVAKLRIVYNTYGEVVSKQAWNKVTGEKISVPAAIPFTNYIDEDKYWAFVERQKLFSRSYEDLYVDRGAVRTKRMKKIMRYDNPFGVPEEVEVYEERPIVERHYDNTNYAADGHGAYFNATFGGTLSSSGISAKLKDQKKSHFELGADVELFNRRLEFLYNSYSNASTLIAPLTFNARAYATGSNFKFDLTTYEFNYRKEWVRSESGDFGLNWIASLRLLDIDSTLTDITAGSTNKTNISGQIPLPMFGVEGIKNMSDHIDFFANVKVFALGDITLSDYQFGGKYYFHPERVEDWRANIGYKGFNLEGESKKESFELKNSGIRMALERSF